MRAILLILLISLAAAATRADPESGAPALATVTQLQDGLIALMRSKDADAARTAAVTQLLRDTHDLPYIARVVLGRHWRELSADDQAKFLAQFEALSVASYTSRFRRYSGEHFDAAEEQTVAGDEHSVRSVLTTASGATHEFVYLLHQDGGRWRIVNIVVDGVSDLALKRAEYGRLMDAGGFPALLAELSQQTERLRARAAETT